TLAVSNLGLGRSASSNSAIFRKEIRSRSRVRTARPCPPRYGCRGGRSQPAFRRQGKTVFSHGLAGQSFCLHWDQYFDRGHSWCGAQARTLCDDGRVLLLDLVFCTAAGFYYAVALDWLAVPFSV